MSWTLLTGAVVALGALFVVVALRRVELSRMRYWVRERDRAVDQGRGVAELEHPVVDLTRCLGCGTCVAVCPEDNVLELVHGQAMVVSGAHCKSIAACARECPVGAITMVLTDADTRRDVPALTDELEAVGPRGLFLAGEVTAHALIQTAIGHGTTVATAVDRRRRAARSGEASAQDRLDLVIVGAGPAGIACALEAKRRGLRFVIIDQAQGVGGTVAKYPRRKLTVVQPIRLPLYGVLDRLEYTKEELMALWGRLIVEQALPLESGQRFESLAREADGGFLLRTQERELRASNVCLAIGRRGTPRQLGVPGEELPKVGYSLLDAHSYRDRRILVVGGGDSAVEAAIALAEQPGNRVVLSYRKPGFFRVSSRNERRLAQHAKGGRLHVVFESEVRSISPDSVELARGPNGETARIANDDVFIMAGGVTPLGLLERAGVSFDPALRESQTEVGEQGPGFARAVTIGFGLSLAALVWALWHFDYYGLAAELRPVHDKHQWLRPGRGVGLGLGVFATAMIVVNLLYVVRRSPRWRFRRGSIRMWMSSHVATGILAFLCALLHAAMSPGDSAGGHAFWALALLIVTGAVGRYFYAYVPRAANGRELELSEVKSRLQRMDSDWEQGERLFRQEARDEVLALVEARQWRGSFPGRVLALLGVRMDLHRIIGELTRRGRRQGVGEAQIAETMALVRRAHRTALMAAHFEDLRALLGTWRYVHRWAAFLMVLLLAGHIFYAIAYGGSS